jgi:hypothetical protein
MTGRPCRPDADFERLWRTLLPGTPFPSCGVADRSDSEAAALLPATDTGDAEPPAAGEARRPVNRR